MSLDQKAFSDHIEKLFFIKRLQARENSFNKFLTGQGILPDGGGLAHGGGLGSGGGLDNSGFKNRRPAVQAEMLSTTKDKGVIEAESNITELTNANMEDFKDEESLTVKKIAKDKKGNTKNITLNGKTDSIWGKTEIKYITNESKSIIGNFNKTQHDPKNFQGTTSKAVIFEKDGVVLKYKSISELCKATGMSKYQILKGFKPKKNGDSFYHEKLEGNLTFVNRKDL
jgi:hypothetical protein